MAENLRLARLYFVILAIAAGGRWVMSFLHVPYAKGTDKLSIVIITLLSSLFYGAFCRRWLGLKLLPAVMLGATLGLSAQIVVFVSTVLSYVFGLETYFNNPIALNDVVAVPLGSALLTRAEGLVANTFTAGIAGALGWAMGALLPESRQAVLPRPGV
jgi:hypothetical protein